MRKMHKTIGHELSTCIVCCGLVSFIIYATSATMTSNLRIHSVSLQRLRSSCLFRHALSCCLQLPAP